MSEQSPEVKVPEEKVSTEVSPVESEKKFVSPLNRTVNSYRQNSTQKTDEVVTLKEEFIKDLKPEELEEYKKMPLDEKFRIKFIETANNMQKYNRLQNEKQLKIQELEKNVIPDEQTQKMKAFFDEAKIDFVAAVNKYKDDLSLPDISTINTDTNRVKDFEGKMKVYQEKDLIPRLEQKHNLGDGNFVYDPAEAHKPGTASYEYRVETERYEKKLKDEEDAITANIAKATEQIQKDRNEQLIKLQKDFYPLAELKDDMSPEMRQQIMDSNAITQKTFVDMLTKIDNMYAEMKKTGKFSADVNPVAIENIFKGVFFEELAGKRVNDAIAKLHAEYKSKGMYLPDNGKNPPVTDINSLNGKSPVPDSMPEQRLKNSPLARQINRYKN